MEFKKKWYNVPLMKAIVLAAGKGTRLKSSRPKALIPLLGKPLIDYPLQAIKGCGITDITTIVGFKSEEVKKHLSDYSDFVLQKTLDGTGGAVKACRAALSSMKNDYVLVINADTPLITHLSLKRLIDHAKNLGLDAACLSAVVDAPAGYGRILRDDKQKFLKIIEEQDVAGSDCFKEINAGAYIFKAHILNKYAGMLRKQPNGEYYLTEIFELLSLDGMKIEAVKLRDINEAMGVNSRKDLVLAGLFLKNKIIEALLDKGVTVIDPNTTLIESDVAIGEDTVIYPFTVIRSGCEIGKDCEIGPFAHIRGRSKIGDQCTIGNFVEVNRSKVGPGSKMKHLSYLGDAMIGAGVNIGAGTITANYDGKNKNKTIMEDGSSTGSNTVLIAPVVMGKKSKTGAGAVVTKNTSIKQGEIYIGVPASPLKKKVIK